MLVTVALAALITSQMTKQYSSTARVFVSTTASDSADTFQGSQFAQQRVASYADVVSGLELSQRVIDSLGLHMSALDLSKHINASVVPNTVVLKIDVTDPDPSQAQRIDQEVVSQLQTFVKEIETPPGQRLPLLKATVVDTPRLPTSPDSPKPLRNLAIGLVLGLLLGFGLAILREVMDTTVKRIEDVPSLRETPVLSALAFDSDVQRTPLISALPSHAPRAEAFRVLRTNLSFIDVDHASKAFVVTSSVPGEGKSTTAVNAALAMASAGQRVLLVDGDLRRPQVHTMLNLEGSVGLTTALVGQSTLEDVIQTHAASGLHVLTAGQLPPNPAELLQSHAMTDLLTRVRGMFDIVVIDTPPLLPVTDAAVMAAQTDGAVVVVRYGKTTKEQLGNAVERLHAVDSEPLGVILNMVPTGRSGGYGYGYGYGDAPEGTGGRGKRAAQAAKVSS
ncbi:MAG: polysaccharide biosynthesis tyrosine autokinase [Marmoricola sp.]|nr:polysaccharide biosynthesis tyrosine autokinase [Marmoricola sp.]